MKYKRYLHVVKNTVFWKKNLIVKSDSIDKKSPHFKEYILPLCVSASKLLKTPSWHPFFVAQPVLHSVTQRTYSKWQ